MFLNTRNLNLGRRQNGVKLNDVQLPPVRVPWLAIALVARAGRWLAFVVVTRTGRGALRRCACGSRVLSGPTALPMSSFA